ncbi:hypothetical protein DESPIG_00295 [Desulfovibrio piger ATCC 29098]|uniref:Uncharacterized protein n=1 Tax=Desulfovibrio piger ATCC 29098 TaxID=411464 RepID=B6WQH1_9BACT|nr:hypothetical protein DESPIG_00295 [Desulfovibrio piger ATCC 29098]
MAGGTFLFLPPTVSSASRPRPLSCHHVMRAAFRCLRQRPPSGTDTAKELL